MMQNTNIENYGTTYIPTFKDKILSGNNLKEMSATEKEEVIDFLLKFYRENGFPYTVLSNEDLIKDFDRISSLDCYDLIEDKILKPYNNAGSSIVKHFSPQFYETLSGISNKKSMLGTFNDDKLLRKVIKNRVDQNFNMTGNMLKQGLGNSKQAYKASIFNAGVAKCIYSIFTKPGDIIYDYSMGFGHRLVAAMSLSHEIKYIGVDPYDRSLTSNYDIFNFLNDNKLLLNKSAEFILSGSEEYCDELYRGKVAIAFSSPPYFNLEKYSNDETQAYSHGYAYFINKWWKDTMHNISILLKDDGIFALNIKENVSDHDLKKDMLGIAEFFGFRLIDCYDIKLTKNVNFRNRGVHKYEPIFILKKM